MWLTVKETASLLSVSERSVQKNALNNKYTCRYIDGTGRGGKQLQILLESLPQEAQDRYNNPGTEEELLSDKFSMTQIQEADYKAKVVQNFKASGLSAEKFLEQFNSENDENLTLRQLYYWQERLTEGGTQALVDSRGGHNKGACSISEEAWEFFYSLYMTLQKRSIQWCYDKTKMKFPDIPSVSAFKRKVRTIPEYAILRYRAGTKAFTDALPSMIRDKSQVKPNDIWCSDHHRADVFVKNSTGHIIRPWITVFSDICSTKIISFIVREEDPNTTVVKKCLRLGMETHGVPYEIYTDNGKDYKARDLSLEYPLSVMNVLGIGKITATPYHGQAKPIERFFRTLEERFGKMFYSYAGNDAKKRPEHMAKTLKKLEQDENIPTLEFYTAQLTRWVEEYNNTAHHGEGMDGQTPNQVYYGKLEKKREVNDRNALRLLCGKTEIRTVDKNGIRLMNNMFCNYDGRLIQYYGKKVMVTYDPDDMENVYIFDMDYRYICTAVSKFKTMFRSVTQADYERAGKEKRLVRQMVKKYKPLRERDTFDLIAGYHMEEKLYAESQAETETLTTPFSEQADKAFEPKATDKSFEQRMIAYANTENEKEPEIHEETGSEEDINFENFMFNYIKNA